MNGSNTRPTRGHRSPAPLDRHDHGRRLNVRITHDAINHLTAAGLCCAALRAHLHRTNDRHIVTHVDKLANAVDEAVKLIAQVWSIDRNLEPAGNGGPHERTCRVHDRSNREWR